MANWTPSDDLIARARAAGRLAAPKPCERWFVIEAPDGRLLAEGQGFQAARLACRTQVEDGEPVAVIVVDGEEMARCFIDHAHGDVIAWSYGDAIRQYDGRAA